MGFLNDAKESFKTAKKLSGGQQSSTLKANMNALEEHIQFRESGGVSRGSNNDDDDDDDDEDDDEDDSDDEDSDDEDEDDSDDDDDDDEDDDEDSDDDDDEDDGPSSAGSGGANKITERAIQLAESGDPVKALSLFELALKMEKENPQRYINLGVTQMR